MNPVDRFLMNALRSRRITKVLLALVIGINAAYVFRSDSAHAKIILLVILALAVAAVIMCELPESDWRTRRGYAFENIMLSFALAASLLGIAG